MSWRVSCRKVTAVGPPLAVGRTCERGLLLCNPAVFLQEKTRRQHKSDKDENYLLIWIIC